MIIFSVHKFLKTQVTHADMECTEDKRHTSGVLCQFRTVGRGALTAKVRGTRPGGVRLWEAMELSSQLLQQASKKKERRERAVCVSLGAPECCV